MTRFARALGQLFLLAELALFQGGCEPEPRGWRPSAEIGVFYGGQVQRLEEVEFSTLHPPKIGFRVWSNREPGDEAPKQVLFQLVRPGSAGRRVTKEGALRIGPTQPKVDHLFEVAPNSKLGLWNVRIVVDGQLVADRALRVVPAR